MPRALPIVILSLVFALSSPSSMQGQAGALVSDSALALEADVILVGRVLGFDRSRLDRASSDGPAETDYQVAVESVIKGQVLQSPVVVRLAGDLFATDSRPGVFTDRWFSRQQRVLLFLDPSEDSQGFEVVCGQQGAFQVLPFGGGDVVYGAFRESRTSNAAEEIMSAPEQLRDLKRFSAWLGKRARGAEVRADYWLDADTADLSLEFGKPLQQEAKTATFDGFLKATQAFGTVSDPAGDTRENAISDISPDLVSAQISSDGTRVQMVVRIVSSTFDPETDRAFIGIDIDENLATGNVGGIDFFILILNNVALVREYVNVGSGGFLTMAELPTTVLADGYLTSVPLSLLRGDAVFSFFVFTDVEFSGLHTVITDFMPNDGLPNALVRPVATAPAAPNNLRVTDVSVARVSLTWADQAETESLFEIERRLGSGSFQVIAAVGENITSFEDSGVGPGGTYAYRVRARNDVGASGYSNVVAVTTPGEVAPTELTALATSTSEILLSWVDNAVSETGYAIEMKAPGGAFASIQSLAADSETTTVAGLDEATTYAFRVRATGGSGDSSFSNEASATTFSSQTGPCLATPTTLCLNGGRFQVEVTWGDFGGTVGSATDAGLVSADSGMFFFFSADNWEMLVKVLDGCGSNQRFWVFAAATTDVEYTLKVTDTATGLVKTYVNPLGTAAPAITDTNAFATCAAQGAASGLGSIPEGKFVAMAQADLNGRSSVEELLPTVPAKQASCVPGPNTLCLNQGRFQVDVDWTIPGGSGVGTVDAFQSADSGLFWFFSPENLELLIKVLDACAINDRVWVFAAATTDVQYTLNVTDTVTGAQKQYFNTAGNAADAVTDTAAFASCP